MAAGLVDRMREVLALRVTLGPVMGSLYLLNRVLRRLTWERVRLYAYRIYAMPVKTSPVLAAGRGKDIEVREIGRGESATQVFPRPAKVIEGRYAQNARCLAAYRKGTFAGFLWLNLGGYDEDEVRCRFVPGPAGHAAWDYDVLVQPEYRLSFVFLRLWDEANAFLQARGVRWSLSRISAFNPASLSAHARLGAIRIDTVFFVRVGSLQVMLARRRPFVHVGLGPRSRPVFEIDASHVQDRRAESAV